ncbi:MAG: hypothetical protein L3K26_13990, partial [Candidatus Hydrogenedentes bacterium]|nr:hypothetical protein [Candidatus Hydrogenedentota bacterium]
LSDAGRVANYLVERDIRWRDRGRLGRPLTTITDPIEGASFRYSENGERLAYFRVEGEKVRSLWVIDTNSTAPNGVPVAAGQLGGYAFSPDGTRIAVTRHRDGGQGTVIFVDAVRGEIEGNGGPGRCDAASWYPDEPLLIVQAYDDETEEDQLWSLSTYSPYERTRLTKLDNGAQREAAVSRSGEWLTTVSETERGPAIVFLPWAPADLIEQTRDAS